jgi:hypothetical protein
MFLTTFPTLYNNSSLCIPSSRSLQTKHRPISEPGTEDVLEPNRSGQLEYYLWTKRPHGGLPSSAAERKAETGSFNSTPFPAPATSDPLQSCVSSLLLGEWKAGDGAAT